MSFQFEVFPFGKYKGTPIDQLPNTYIVYALEKFNLPDELVRQLEKALIINLNMDFIRVESFCNYLMEHGYNQLIKELFGDE